LIVFERTTSSLTLFDSHMHGQSDGELCYFLHRLRVCSSAGWGVGVSDSGTVVDTFDHMYILELSLFISTSEGGDNAKTLNNKVWVTSP
uniref:Peptidase S1 domain-containing protein n=1 Tax=Haemonchus placei TaxID=6290 RepID=A0A0N4WRJ3_HAEPC